MRLAVQVDLHPSQVLDRPENPEVEVAGWLLAGPLLN